MSPPPPAPYKVRYDQAQVWRSAVRSLDDVQVIQSLRDEGYISIWKLTHKHADFLVPKDKKKYMRNATSALGLDYKVLIANVQRMIDATRSRDTPWSASSLRRGHRLDFKHYPSLEIIEEFYTYLKNNFDLIAIVSVIGTSIEHRPIKMIKITNGKNLNKKRVLLLGGQHAREWVSITTALYIANEIVTHFDSQPEYVQNIEWYIIPVVNPDGYQFSRTDDRFWRKSRRRKEFQKPECYGVDTNRNFPKEFAKNAECSEDYSGPFPFSEPETVAVKNVLESMGTNIPLIVVDFHSYGQLLLHPWGFDTKSYPKLKTIEPYLRMMKSAIRNASGQKYRYGTPYNLLGYTAPGVGIDWFHSKGVKLSIAIEGRDTGTKGFMLPTDEIEATGNELWQALKVLVE